MISSIELQEIHDGCRDRAWQAMWHKRGARLITLAADLEEMTRQRDMLARLCSEQAKQIAAFVAPFAPTPRDVIGDAIRKMQDGGVR